MRSINTNYKNIFIQKRNLYESDMSNHLNALMSSHMNVAKQAFEKRNFELMNIFSNRIMSDAFLLDNLAAGTIGFILKNVALYGTRVLGNPIEDELLKEESDSKLNDLGNEIFKTLESGPIESAMIATWWKAFIKFRNEVGFLLLTTLERESYKTLSNDSSEVLAKKLFTHLTENKEVLLKKNGNILAGIINELDRTINVAGSTDLVILMCSVVTSMQWVFEYYQNLFENRETDPEKNPVAIFFYPQIDSITPIFRDNLNDTVQVVNDNLFREVSDIIWINVREWRRLFLEYLDLPNRLSISLPQSQKKVPEIHPDAKAKITDLMAKKLEQELKMK